MNPYWLILLTVFFSVFHVLGGGAPGVGVRGLKNGSDKSNFFIVWGSAMGGLVGDGGSERSAAPRPAPRRSSLAKRRASRAIPRRTR